MTGLTGGPAGAELQRQDLGRLQSINSPVHGIPSYVGNGFCHTALFRPSTSGCQLSNRRTLARQLACDQAAGFVVVAAGLVVVAGFVVVAAGLGARLGECS